MEHHWKHKTLEQLERDYWPPLSADEGSHLINTCNQLRKKTLIDFTVEDLRIMIGQNIGLKFLIPMAIEVLKNNIVAEGNLYEGDLLTAVLASEQKYWEAETEYRKVLVDIFTKQENFLKDFDTTWEIKKHWFALYREFNEAMA